MPTTHGEPELEADEDDDDEDTAGVSWAVLHPTTPASSNITMTVDSVPNENSVQDGAPSWGNRQHELVGCNNNQRRERRREGRRRGRAVPASTGELWLLWPWRRGAWAVDARDRKVEIKGEGG